MLRETSAYWVLSAHNLVSPRVSYSVILNWGTHCVEFGLHRNSKERNNVKSKIILGTAIVFFVARRVLAAWKLNSNKIITAFKTKNLKVASRIHMLIFTTVCKNDDHLQRSLSLSLRDARNPLFGHPSNPTITWALSSWILALISNKGDAHLRSSRLLTKGRRDEWWVVGRAPLHFAMAWWRAWYGVVIVFIYQLQSSHLCAWWWPSTKAWAVASERVRAACAPWCHWATRQKSRWCFARQRRAALEKIGQHVAQEVFGWLIKRSVSRTHATYGAHAKKSYYYSS